MAPITTEADWMSCCEPRDLLKSIDRQVNPLRFRWLAIEWGRRIRNVFVPQDLRCFDAFDRWVTADGPHPRDVYEQLQFDYIGEIFWSGGVSAQYCAHAIRNENYLQAAIYGGLSFSELYLSYIHHLFPFPIFHTAMSHTQWRRWREPILSNGRRMEKFMRCESELNSAISFGMSPGIHFVLFRFRPIGYRSP